MTVTSKPLIVVVGLLQLACSSERQYLRLVSPDVYEGVQAIRKSSQQLERETNSRYDRLYNFTRDYLIDTQAQTRTSNQELAENLKEMSLERIEFQNSTAQAAKIKEMCGEVLYGLGWEEGPRDPLPLMTALGTGALAGVLTVLAF